MLQKAVRTQYRNGSDLAKGMTGYDFFSQFPSLHSFLLTQLRIATSGNGFDTNEIEEMPDIKTINIEDVETWNKGDMHPSLYPVLLLLSVTN
jgi:hypothetical protein